MCGNLARSHELPKRDCSRLALYPFSCMDHSAGHSRRGLYGNSPERTCPSSVDACASPLTLTPKCVTHMLKCFTCSACLACSRFCNSILPCEWDMSRVCLLTGIHTLPCLASLLVAPSLAEATTALYHVPRLFCNSCLVSTSAHGPSLHRIGSAGLAWLSSLRLLHKFAV